jgi:hypothetical protein
MSSDRRYQPLFDVHPMTGTSIEVFYADGLATCGRRGAGWFWHFRLRGFAPDGTARGPFPSRYAAYRDALATCTGSTQFGRRIT